jgi:hypothetical protein
LEQSFLNFFNGIEESKNCTFFNQIKAFLALDWKFEAKRA